MKLSDECDSCVYRGLARLYREHRMAHNEGKRADLISLILTLEHRAGDLEADIEIDNKLDHFLNDI